MKLCGLTGGVGMGKSTAAGFFSHFGFRIVDTDRLAHELVQPGQPALTEIKEAFGPSVIAGDGSLRRDELARLVFSNPASRGQLEAILHPRIRERWQEQVNAWQSEGHPFAMVVIPLLFETAAEPHFDKIICVACSSAGQRQRLQARGWDAGQIDGRIAAQMPVEQKIARSHFVIWTEGSPDIHRRQIAAIMQKI